MMIVSKYLNRLVSYDGKIFDCDFKQMLATSSFCFFSVCALTVNAKQIAKTRTRER